MKSNISSFIYTYPIFYQISSNIWIYYFCYILIILFNLIVLSFVCLCLDTERSIVLFCQSLISNYYHEKLKKKHT